MCLQPVVGAISDRVGRRPVLLAFGILGTLLTVPILTALEQASQIAWSAFFLIMAALVIVSGYTAINAVVKAELFPTSIRAMGVGFPYAVTVALFGGTAQWVALYLKEIGHETAFYWYVTGCIFISLVVYALMRDTKRPVGHATGTLERCARRHAAFLSLAQFPDKHRAVSSAPKDFPAP